MLISIIVAVANNGVIGKEGGLPWYLPAELAYFKQKTMGHPVIMGRRTHQSIAKALPGRKNIVISRNKSYKPAAGCVVVNSLKQAFNEAKGAKELFVIGGEEIYRQAVPLADKLYMTKVEADIDGDKFFHFDEENWRQVDSKKHTADEKNKYAFEFTVWERVRGLA